LREPGFLCFENRIRAGLVACMGWAMKCWLWRDICMNKYCFHVGHSH
jgi:hypothetical protein